LLFLAAEHEVVVMQTTEVLVIVLPTVVTDGLSVELYFLVVSSLVLVVAFAVELVSVGYFVVELVSVGYSVVEVSVKDVEGFDSSQTKVNLEYIAQG